MTTFLNMLPQGFHRRRLMVRRLRQWTCVWGIAMTLAIAFSWGQHRDYQALNARLIGLENDYAPIKKLQTELISNRKELAEIHHRETLALQLSDRRSMLTLLGLVTQAARSCDGEVSIRQLSLGEGHRRSSPRYGRPALSTLTIDGLGKSNLSVARFAAALRMTNAFCQVQLKSTAQKQGGLMSVRSYCLECTFD